jgi:hypothetical protein
MVGPTPVLCPACRATIAETTTTCDLCTARLARDPSGRPYVVFPEIRPGEPIVSLDFRYVPLPSESARDRRDDNGDVIRGTAEGIVNEAANDTLWSFTQPYLRLRDACIAASCVTYAPGLYPRVFLRNTTVKGARIRYDLVASPEDRTFRINRFCGAAHEAGVAVLQPWTKHPAVAPIGARNVIELRALGATLQAWINGVYVAAVHDAVLGIGGIGVANVRTAKDAKHSLETLWEWMQVRTVAP